ncbi:signal peptidase I [Cellulomonas sp. 73-92]|uniref:signal peptidase I n=1 Tax=Cellulomonas sp. 73-92 TaxID=1895740 RepID=UPI00345CF365
MVGLERVAMGPTESRPAITDHSAAARARVPGPRFTWRRHAGPVLAGLVAAGLVLAGWPAVLGGATTCADVQGHSMDPTYHEGDMIIARKTNTVNVGDIVVYKVPPGYPHSGVDVVHRVAGGSLDGGLVMRGDHNPADDPSHPTRDDVIGVVKLHVPWVGHVLRVLRTPAFLAAPFIGLILELVWPKRTKTRQRYGSGDAEWGARPSSTTAAPRLS